MAKYRITAPDGNSYEITAPDDATQDQVLAYAQANYQGASQPSQPAAPQSQADPLAAYTRAAQGTGSINAPSGSASSDAFAEINARNRAMAADPAYRAQQAQNDAFRRQSAFGHLPGPVQALAGAGSRVEAAALGAGQMLGLAGANDVADFRQRERAMEGSGAATAGKIGGDVAMLATPGSAISKLPGLGTRVLANAGLGAGYGALAPVGEGESRAVNTGIGAGVGALGQGLGEGLGALGRAAAARVDPIKQRAIAYAKQQGIPLHLSQVGDSVPIKAAASMAKYLPFSGAGKAASKQQTAFNKAVGKTFGADAGQLSDDVMAAARKQIGDGYEAIYARNNIPLSPDAIRRLVAVETSAGRRLTQDQAQVVRNQLDDILTEAGQSGMISGQKYQSLRTQIMKAEGPDATGNAVKELRKALDDVAAEAVGPQDAAALRALRSQWANLRTTEKALGQVAGSGGNVKPASLWPLVRNGSTKEMRELARVGQVLLKDPIPDSGTAGRTIAASMLGGGGLAAGPAAIPSLLGLLAGGATVGRGLNSNALAKLVAGSPQGTALSTLGKLLPVGSVAATPAVMPKAKKRFVNRSP
jgi:hypothetical protein